MTVTRITTPMIARPMSLIKLQAVGNLAEKPGLGGGGGGAGLG